MPPQVDTFVFYSPNPKLLSCAMVGLAERDFFRKWLAATFAPAFKRTGLVNLVVGIVLGFIAWKWPPASALGTTLRWPIPVLAFLSFFAYQAIRAPLEILRNAERERDALTVARGRSSGGSGIGTARALAARNRPAPPIGRRHSRNSATDSRRAMTTCWTSFARARR